MSQGPANAELRTGWGFDAHRLGGEPPLLLGGVVVSDTEGLVATSDGDVLAHAVTDALMGAAVLGDMGDHFPGDDPAMEGADSMFLLRQAATMSLAEGWVPVHLDATVIAESIRVAPHREAIREGLAEALGIPVEVVAVKATTTDGMGFIGEGLGIATVAVITVERLT
jgi:2-C-methyl-D-erythritol 2,4-cyclodiphosphate synthase